MALIRDFLASLSPRLAEADPLPPDDRVVMGSTLVLGDLYRDEAPRLLRYFNRRVDPQDSLDLVHESFVRLANAEADNGTERVIDNPQAYLSTVATNLLRNQAKSALERARTRSIPIDEVTLAAPDLMAALEARDMLHRIQNALQRLSPKTRDIFLAHRVDGLSHNEIAKATGLSVKGVEWHMTKAIAHLDRTLRSR